MTNYLIINITLSLIVIYSSHKKSLKANHQLALIMFALASWLVPYDLLIAFLKQVNASAQVIYLPIENRLQLPSTTPAWSLNLVDIFFALLSSGVVYLVINLYRHFNWLNSMLNSPTTVKDEALSRKYNTLIYRHSCSQPGLVTGILDPLVFISDSVTRQDLLDVVVKHEMTHVRLRDNQTMALLCVIESIFWWNPLVMKLAANVKFVIELRCDEQTSREFEQEGYLIGLAELIKYHHKDYSQNFSLSFFEKQSESISRLKALNGEIVKNAKYAFGLLAMIAVVFSGWVVAQVAVKNESEEQRVNSAKMFEPPVYFEENKAYAWIGKNGAPIFSGTKPKHNYKEVILTSYYSTDSAVDGNSLEIENRQSNTPTNLGDEESGATNVKENEITSPFANKQPSHFTFEADISTFPTPHELKVSSKDILKTNSTESEKQEIQGEPSIDDKESRKLSDTQPTEVNLKPKSKTSPIKSAGKLQARSKTLTEESKPVPNTADESNINYYKATSNWAPKSIYMWRDENGVLRFSDRKREGAKVVNINKDAP